MTHEKPQYKRGVSPVILSRLEPHRDAVIEAWRGAGLTKTGNHYGMSAASLRLVLLHWLGAEVYECQAYLHRANKAQRTGRMSLAWPNIVPRIYIRRWPEFSQEEQDSLLEKVRGWLAPEIAVLRRGVSHPEWEGWAS